MGRTLAEAAATAVTPVDFRRPSRISRDAVVALEGMHDAFARRVATAWSTSSYSVLEVEHVATEQLSIDDFVRGLPVPTALGTVRVDRLDETAFVQVDLPLALLLVERLLGGPGDAASQAVARRPTDLETALVTQELLGPAVQAIDEALRELPGDASELVGFDTQPQPLQLGSPGELLLLLTYRVEVRGELPAQGLVTLVYPVAPLVSRLDVLLAGSTRHDDEDAARVAVEAALLDVAVEVRVRLGGDGMPASALARLEPGEVLLVGHPVSRPAELMIDGRPVGSAHLGRRGRRAAIQVVDPPAAPSAAGAAPTSAAMTASAAAAASAAHTEPLPADLSA